MSTSVNGLPKHVSAAQLPLEKLAANTQVAPADKVAELSRQFEAVLLRQIFAEAQKTVFHSKSSGPAAAADIYKDLLNNELADQVSRSGSVGLAKSLSKELQHQLKPAQDQSTSKPIAQDLSSSSALGPVAQKVCHNHFKSPPTPTIRKKYD